MEYLTAGWAVLGEDVTHLVALLNGDRQPGDKAFYVPIGYTEATLAELAIVSVVMAILVGCVMQLASILARLARLDGQEAVKFNLSLRELLFYTTSTGVHLWLYGMHHKWVQPQHFGMLFAHWPTYEVPQEMRVTYFFELSWYLAGILLLFMDFKRKDFLAMFIHHVATIFMIGLSWHVGGVLVGIVVIILHNISDVFLHCAKMLNYVHAEMLANLFLATFGVTFFVLRLVIFPYLIYTSIQHVPVVLDGVLTGWGFIIILKIVLVPLHAYWFIIIVRLAMRLMAGENQKSAVNAEYDDGHKDSTTDATASDKTSGNQNGLRRRR